MKKVIVMCALVCAGFAQAASINWSISGIQGAGTGAAAPAGQYTAMLFVTANSTGVGDFAITTVDSVVSAMTAGDWATVSSLASATKTLNNAGVMGGATGLSTSFASGSLSAFAVILDTTTGMDLSTANHYYLVNGGAEQTASFTSASGAKMLVYGAQTNSGLEIGATGGWQAVPEPTSGLLMLVGLAGLALRRRRA